MLELQAPFWKLEAQCLRVIGKTVFDTRLVYADSEEYKRTPQVPGTVHEREGLASEERETSRDMAPDYGNYLIERGLSDATQFFYGVGIDRVDIVAMRHFTIMLNHDVDGIVYAVSFDYEVIRLAELMSFAPEPVRVHVADSVVYGSGFPRSISLGVTLTVNIEARVGQPQHSGHEIFIPLVVKRFFR